MALRRWRFLASAVVVLLGACGGGGADAPAIVEPVPRQASGPSLVAAACSGGAVGGTAFVNAEVEPWAALDPTRDGRIVAAWQQDRWSNGGARALVAALSTDAGLTWQRRLVPFSRCGGARAGDPGDYERATDPWVDVAPDGTMHLMGLAFSGAALSAGSANAMLASRSIDGGQTWSVPSVLVRNTDGRFNDKNTITADPVAAGFVYAVWDRLDPDGNGPTLLARSTDGGTTWEAAREIYVPAVAGGVSQTIGNRIVVIPAGAQRGVLVNAFTQIDTVAGSSTARLAVQRSLDRGLTWEPPVFVADKLTVGTVDAASGLPIRDGGIVPTFAAGPDGGLWIAWQDARFTAGAHDAIALSRSTDGGLSWSAPVAVNRDPSVPAFTPVLQVRSDGLVGLLHYDLRNDTPDPATLPANAWLLTSRDGVNWSEAAASPTFDLRAAPNAGGLFLGDYHGLVGAVGGFMALLVTTTPDTNNRTDVFAPLVATGSAAVSRSFRAQAAVPALPSGEPARLREARHAAIVRAMEQRIGGAWPRAVGAVRPAPARSGSSAAEVTPQRPR
jgi:hypothetical protein